MALSIADIVKGISMAVHNVHHGARDRDNKPVAIGLKREDQPVLDQRVMDGFGVSLQGNLLVIRYSSHEPLSNLHEKRFEREIERRIEDIKKFIQKEFEYHTGSNLRLKDAGDIKILVESSNRIKAMIKVVMPYEILNIKEEMNLIGCHSCTEKAEEMAAYFKKLEKGKLKAKNDTRKVEKKDK